MSEASTENPNLRVARELTERLVAGDAEGAGALYADDAVVWRNLDGRELVKRQVLKVLAMLTGAISGLRYENVRVRPTPDGFVQQHTLRGTTKDGAELRADACFVAVVRDGRIVRVDEYLDSAAMAPLMGGRA